MHGSDNFKEQSKGVEGKGNAWHTNLDRIDYEIVINYASNQTFHFSTTLFSYIKAKKYGIAPNNNNK